MKFKIATYISDQDNIVIHFVSFQSYLIQYFQQQYHYIREKATSGDLKIEYCPTNKMQADILTKALPPTRHEELASEMIRG